MKKLNLRKYGEVILGDGDDSITIPIKTLSISEELAVKFNEPSKLPTQISTLTESEKQQIAAQDPLYKKEVYVAYKVIDKTSALYKEHELKKEKYTPILEVAKYINFNKEVTTDEGTVPFYEYLGIKNKNDWFEICEKLDEIGLSENHIEKIIIEVNKLKGNGLFKKLSRLQEITNMDYVTLLAGLEDYVENRKIDSANIFSAVEKYAEELENDTKA